jgi:sporulation protein YlmC with PRC-barrel domain
MNSRFSLVLVFGVMLSLFVPVYAQAADDPPTPGTTSNETVMDRQTTMTENDMIFQSSQLSDLNVFNKDNADKKLGNVDNLIINEHTGHVLFAILDTGVGGSKIAVPWSTLQLRKDTTSNNKDKYSLLLNKSADELKSAPTFDSKQIAQITDPNWQKSVETFFGVHMVAKPEDMQGSGQLSAKDLIFESSKLSDMNVYNRSDTSHKLGSLDNLIIDAHTGTVQYAILSTGMMGKLVPVPWEALLLQKEKDKDKSWLTLDKTSDDLKDAPTFNKDQITKVTDPTWQQSVNKYFGVRMSSKPKP